MEFALLIIFVFVAYGLTTLFRRWIDIPTLLAVAIGCAVNANIFNPLTAPIMVGPLTFSIEIVLYTLFMYTIVVRILDYGYNDAKRMTFTSVAAIIISAFIELMANLMTKGFSSETFKQFSYYLFSSIGTILGVWVMVFITIFCRKKSVNVYVIIPLAIAASSIIHSLFFFGGVALVNWKFDIYSVQQALGTIIGKGICILLSMFCYFINQRFWKPLNLAKKEQEKEQGEEETKTV